MINEDYCSYELEYLIFEEAVEAAIKYCLTELI